MNIISKWSHWYFTKGALPYWCIFIIDCLTVLLSGLLVYTMYNGVLHTLEVFWQVIGTLCVYLVFYIVGFRLFHTYSGIIRFSSFVDLQQVGFAMLTGLVLIGITRLLGLGEMLEDIRLRDLVLSAFLATLAMWAIRVLVKYLYDSTFQQSQAERIFIYGVKQGGISLAKSIRNQDPAKYILTGFVSDVTDIQHRMLMGVQVYANDEKLVEIMKKKHATILFVSPAKNESLRENLDMVNHLTENGIRIFMIPTAQEWDGKSDVTHAQLREVEIEDLLPREKIEVDMETIGKQLNKKRF